MSQAFWDDWTNRAESATATVSEVVNQTQNFMNAIQPLIDKIGPQKADNTEDEIAQGKYNEPAGLFVISSGNHFPIPGIGRVHIIWPILLASGLVIYLVVSKKKSGRRK